MRIPAKAPGILSPLECQKLLNAAGKRVLPLIAIQAFCGVRNAETLRLSWSDIDMTRGFVHVSAEQAKGARRRLIEMPSNLKEWLLPYVGRAGKLWPWSHVEYYLELGAARANAGIRKWPSNALRHSYASYHLAFHQNAAALALQMGHTSQAMIFSNYREVVTPDEAQRYWMISPRRPATNVVPMEVHA
jgi:integrase